MNAMAQGSDLRIAYKLEIPILGVGITGMEKRKKEMNRQKEMQKRKLQEAISLHHDFLGVGQNKKVQKRIINNFRFFNRSTYLHQSSPQFVSATRPPSMYQPPSHLSQYPYYYTLGVNGSIVVDTTIDPLGVIVWMLRWI